MEQMAAMASLILGGALERHPRMRVAFLESGTGWLPYWLSRLDGHAEWMAGSECAGLSLTPTEYFARQCVISTDPDDPLVASVCARVGADHVMWASDFPHPDALYPHAVDSFLKEMAETSMPADHLDTLLWGTPMGFYRLHTRVRDVASGAR
jgi:predicted TIM-barrel fold metal-dependent hydrolase